MSRATLDKSPKDVRILVLEGMALTGLGKDLDALAAYRSAIKIAPDYLPAVEAAAEIEYRRGMPEAAARLERVLALRPGESTAHAMLGALAWKKSECNAAVEHFSQAKPAIASEPDALREFGACLSKLKRPEDAAGAASEEAGPRSAVADDGGEVSRGPGCMGRVQGVHPSHVGQRGSGDGVSDAGDHSLQYR